MAKVYYEKDADLNVLKGKKIAIIGFGSQGAAQSQNLKDSGLDVVIGLREGSAHWEKVKEAGLTPMTIEEAAKAADIVQILTPDETQADVYKQSIKKYMKKGKTLAFSHGFNIHFKLIKPSKDINVIMIAPKGPGPMVRQMYVQGGGVPSLIAIHQDATGDAKQIALAHAKGLGGARAGVFETTFKEETETDLFGEQTVLCGGTSSLIMAGFETLVEAGYQPEMAYFECCHELKLIVDLIYKEGIAGMRKAISNTAEYGDLTVGPRTIDARVKKNMAKALKRIQTGAFAREWIKENKNGCTNFNAMREKDKNHQIEKVGTNLRAMMPWLKKSN
ncbi:ketol-acid reductoisomerase [Candidatus Saganbacteria bacterium]|nr:ketol-acid reductoisomerase [Candidatus Saganbacteria bacterium]